MTQPEPEQLSEPAEDAAGQWHRLSPWTILMSPIKALPQFLPATAGLVAVGVNNPRLLAVVAPVVLALLATLPWLFTRYRVTDDHIQIRRGFVSKKMQTARRDRVRSVDLKANVLQRVLRVTDVVIGTGESESMKLSSLASVDGQRLAQELLLRTKLSEAASADTAVSATTQDVADTLIAQFRPGWLRFSAFSLAGFGIMAIALGALNQFVREWIPDSWVPNTDRAYDVAESVPLVVALGSGVVLALVLGVVLSVVAYAVSYANFTLVRRPDKTVRSTRGLLTSTQVTIEEKRIRGVSVLEPLLMRIPRGAKASLIATGSENSPLLMPPAPRAEVFDAAHVVIGDQTALAATLTDHGPAARRRRYTRALWPCLIVIAAAAVIVGVTQAHWALVALPLLTIPLSLAGAALRVRHLGHLLTERSIAVGRPRVARVRDVVTRDGILGWSQRQSFFQRRVGVCTLTVVTAAGDGRYALVDLTDDDSAELMHRTAPKWVAPYLR